MKRLRNFIPLLFFFVIFLVLLILFRQTYMKNASSQSIIPNQQEAQQQNTDSEESSVALNAIYMDYSEEAVKEAFSNGNKVLLFFKAPWCPTCNAADRDINKNYNDLPKDVVILKVDYDNETALKEKYNVIVQHTFVQIDENLEQINVWNGGGVIAISDNII